MKDFNIGCVGMGRDSTYYTSILMSLARMSREANAKLTPEEREERDRKYQEQYEKERIEHFINQGKCPECGSKLTRGTKDKNNNYKRLWTCLKCDRKYYK